MKAFAKVSFSCAVDLFIFVRTGKQATAKIPVNASSLEYYVEMCVHPIWSLTLQGKNTYENCKRTRNKRLLQLYYYIYTII